uniref:Secreted protein n=1 Tax=Ixodes scapularis TaxID=6945 RepID=A0A4D5S062_IXOSC
MVPSLVSFFFLCVFRVKGKQEQESVMRHVYIYYIYIYIVFKKKNGFGCVLTLQQTAAAGLLASSRASQSEHSTFVSPFFPNLTTRKGKRNCCLKWGGNYCPLFFRFLFWFFLFRPFFFFFFLS